jgi:rod shape-determining protein MreC
VYDKTVRRRRAVLGLLVICSLILLTASFGGSSGPLGSVQRGVFEVISPIQDGASRALKPARDLFGWVGDTLNAKDQNKSLRKERDQLRQEVVQLQDAQRQNEQLRALVDLGKTIGLDKMGPVTARVSAINPNLFVQTMFINKGSADGVARDQPVISGAGLVGKISLVTSHSAKVTLLTDSSFGASAKISETGVSGFVKPAVGSPHDLVMDYTASSDQVARGDTVVTKGTDASAQRLHSPSLFPPDVPIGRVTKVDDPGTDQQKVHVRPFVNTRELNYVQVLTGTVAANRA